MSKPFPMPQAVGGVLPCSLAFHDVLSIFFGSVGHRKLKTHLQHLRWKGARNSSPQHREKCCARCQRALGLLLNRGAVCLGCSHRVCSECRVFLRRTSTWKCTVCFEDR